MKRVLKIAGVIILLAIAFVLIAAIFVPKTFRMEKSIVINAPKEQVWLHTNSLQSLEKWSPWAKKDPNVQVSFEGTEGAVGSVYKWKGNKHVGEGTQTIIAVDPKHRLDTKLHFIEPFEGNADAFISLSDTVNATKATWGFDTRYAYPMNAMLLFVDMDNMMGKEYKAGLSELKRLSESH